MGPRLERRGRENASAGPVSHVQRFNGTARGWNAAGGPRLSTAPCEPRGFNGAAAGTPRAATRSTRTGETLLRFNGAAAGTPRAGTPGATFPRGLVASMGPRLERRGRWAAAAKLSGIRGSATLQWGRGWNAAGGTKTEWVIEENEKGLQWGRGWNAAGGGALAKRVAHAGSRASMGPRLERRGRGSRGCVCWPPRHRFNGAAAGTPRAASPRQGQPPIPDQASMGPRLERRGRYRDWHSSQFYSWASMGPRLERRGRCRPGGRCAIRAQRASMGPRLERRGRRLRRSVSAASTRGFNGAAAGTPRAAGTVRVRRALVPVLQWGRGWNAAGGGHGARAKGPRAGASMGPRLERRGRGESTRRCDSGARPASMGPRLERRGRPVTAVTSPQVA